MIRVCNRGERMRKMLLVLLIVGVLMLGTCSIIAEAYECGFQVHDFLDDRDPGDSQQGGSSPCGGGGGGAGAPG
jgi:hypothetical protein